MEGEADIRHDAIARRTAERLSIIEKLGPGIADRRHDRFGINPAAADSSEHIVSEVLLRLSIAVPGRRDGCAKFRQSEMTGKTQCASANTF